MTELTKQQKKALTAYLQSWEITSNGDIQMPDGATDRFCELLLQHPPWSEMWSMDEVVGMVEETWIRTRDTASGSLLASPSSFRKEIARRLQDEFESYPEDYFVYIELPNVDPDGLSSEAFLLSEQIAIFQTKLPSSQIGTLVRPDWPEGVEDLVGGIPVYDASTRDMVHEALRPISGFLLEQDSVYVRVKESGAMPGLLAQGQSILLSRALTLVKVIVFFGLEIGSLTRREVFRDRHLDAGSRTIVHASIHAINSQGKSEETLPRDFENFLRGITLGRFESNAKSSYQELGASLQPIMPFLSMQRLDGHAQRITASIEWLIDSLMSSNYTTSLVQSCIGIEAILGDSTSGISEPGITSRLVERFAYLMGESAGERSELREKFRTVFVKRGELIHARRYRYSPHDLRIVHMAQEMLQAIIRKELSLLLSLPRTMLSCMKLKELRPDLTSS